jgi:hypothetical protein
MAKETLAKMPEGRRDLRKVVSKITNRVIKKEKVKDNVTLMIIALHKF